MNKILKITVIFVNLLNICQKFVNCLNASEIDSFVLLHNKVKNTLIEIAINGRCDSPKPTVVYINETQDKLYLPRATILYRCSDQFACCPNPRHSCLASDEEEVDIGFYVLTKTEDQITERSIEVLKFKNHTKCSCIRKDSQIPKESKDILLVSDSTKQELHSNSTLIKTKTTERVSQSTGKPSVITTFIEKHLKTKNSTQVSVEDKSDINSDVTKLQKNTINTTLKPLSTDPKSTSKTTVPYIKTTKPTFLTSKNTSKTYSSTLTTRMKTTEIKLKSTITTTKRITKRVSKMNAKPIVTTIRPTIQTKIKEKENNLNSITTPDEMTHKTRVKVLTTTPLPTTTQVRSKGTLVPLIRSSINYEELEREEDLKPEEDVIYNNGNGFDLFYTNGIFFRPLTTTPYRLHRSIERVTPKCG